MLQSTFTRWLNVWVALALGLLLNLGAWAAEPAHLPEMKISAVLDATEQADLPDVIGKDFTPIRVPFSRGPTPAVTWFRIELAPTDAAAQAVLMVRPQQLDDLRLYRQEAGGAWQAHQAGDRTAYASRERKELYPSFDLDLRPGQGTVVYVRLQTTSAHVIHFSLMTPNQAAAWDSGLQLGMGLYMGALLIIAVSSLLRWGITRDSLWAAGAAFQFQTFVFLMFMMGFAARYIWPEQPAKVDFLTTLLTILNLLLATLFHWVVFRRFSTHRWLAWVEAFLTALCAGFLVLALLGQARLALGLNTLLMALSTFIGFVLLWFINTPNPQLRWVMRSTYLMTIGTATYFALPLLKVVPLQENHLFPALLPIAGVVAMQFIVALYNDILKAREAEQTRLHAQQVELQLASEERQHAHTRHFMGMLLHELKSPLAAIRLAGQSLQRLLQPEPSVQTRLTHIDHAVQSIDQVLERSRDMDRMENTDSPLQFKAADLDALVQDWVARSGQDSRIALQAPPPGQTVHTDPMLLGLMVNNLLDNALKYSPDHSAVQLQVQIQRPEDGSDAAPRLRIRVRNAVGRAGKPDPQKLFSKYYRADTAQYLSGTGLGLSWVHGVARQAQGHVRYLPEDEHIVFELELPC